MQNEVTDLEAEMADIKALLQSVSTRELTPSSDLTERIMGAVQLEKAKENSQSAEPSPDLAGRIMKSIALEKAREIRIARRMRRIAASIAGIAAVLVVIFAPLFKSKSPVHTNCSSEFDKAITMAEDAADWLVAQQCEDGTWSPSDTGGNEAFRPALTALALMALQRHAPVRHASAITKAEQALIAMQTEDGAFSEAASSKLYNHAFVTFALLGLENQRKESLSPTIRRAIAFSLRNQNHFGAWDYSMQDPGNTALTVWQIGLLIRAKEAGWKDEAGQLRRGLAWLKKQGHDGYFDYRADFDRQYTPHSGSMTLTAMATSTLLEASATFPDLRNTAENAAESLRIAYGRSEEREAYNHYRDYFLAKIFNDSESVNTMAVSIVSQHTQPSSEIAAPWKAKDIWATTGGDLYATVMAMLSVRRI